MTEPIWLPKAAIIALHERSLSEHGGLAGVRDAGLLESALGKPLNLFAYGERSLWLLAASYAFGIAKNHPFHDGNKRSAFVAGVVFLDLNGVEFEASETDAVIEVLALAAGERTEKEFARFLERNSRVRQTK